MRYLVAAVALSLCVAIVSASPMPQPPPPVDLSKVYINGVTYAGSGCPANSVAISKSDNWAEITLAFDQYVASIGPGIPITQNRKNCNLNINLHYPEGLQFAVYETDYTGFAQLESKVRATHQSDYWFAGFANQKATLRSTWVGPFTNTYSFTDTLTHEATVFSPCGASTTLNINTQLYLDNSQNHQGSGQITTETIDHKVTTTLGLEWTPC